MASSGAQAEDRRAREQFINRPLPNELRDKYITLFSHPDLTLKDLQEQATSKQGLGQPEDELGGVALRSIFWRIYLGTLKISHVSSSTPRSILRQGLETQRQQYDTLRRKWLISPDGRWATDCTRPEGIEGARSDAVGTVRGDSAGSAAGSMTWDPLNLGESNPWQTWFAQSEVRATIEKDVERTFPDIPYFTDPYVRKIITTILFLWAVENPEIGYRQGMHELLAVLLLVCDTDSLERDSPQGKRQAASLADARLLNVPRSPLQRSMDDGRHSPSGEKMEDAMYMVLNRRYLEHDVYGVFQGLMEHGRHWYEWRRETVEGSLAHGRASKNQPMKGRIIEMSEHLQGVLLRRVDPLLAKRLEDVAIEGQIWGIRWIRLLFTRELPLASALRLWDGLFAMRDQIDNLIESVCAALLLRIRHLLIPEDYGAILTLLLRYPAGSIELPLDTYLILSQAIKILQSPTAATGAAIALENQQVLGIQAVNQDEPETSSSSTSSTYRGKRQSPSYYRGKSGTTSSPAKTYGFESFTRGLMDRAQASGFDKALSSTVSTLSEFRRNLPELPATASASTFPFRSFTPERTTTPTGTAQFPTLDSLSSHLSPLHMPPRTLREADREIAELRLAMIGMGKTLSNWVDTLVECQAEATNERVAAALQGLRRLQGTLIDGDTVTASELARDWSWSHELATTPSMAAPTITMNPPESGQPGSSLDVERKREEVSSQTPETEKAVLPPNTFALEPPSAKTSWNSGATYSYPINSFSRAPQSPTPWKLSPVTHATLADTPISAPPVNLDEVTSATTPAPKHEIQYHQHVPVTETDKPSILESAIDEQDVDPLSGLSLNSEPGGGAYGLKRLGKDPLKGLGLL